MAEGEVTVEIKQEPPPPYDNENPSESNNSEIPTDSNNSENPPESNQVESTTGSGKCLEYLGNAILYLVVGIFLIVFIPAYLLYAGAMWLFCNIDVLEDNPGQEDGDNQGKKMVFQKVQELQEKAKSIGKLPHVIQSRLVIFVFSWLIVNFSVPFLRNKLIFGAKLWKWTLAITVILCGYHLINMLTRSLIYTLCLNSRFRKKQSSVYYLKGTRRSLNLVAQAILILVTWVSFFRTSRGLKKTDDTHTLLHICSWTFVTFGVLAVLWLLKSVLLLKWKADAVYRRFSQRILVAGVQVYFLGCIFGWRSGVFKPTSDEEKEKIMLEGADADTDTDTNIEPASEGVVAQPEGVEEASRTASNIKKEEANIKVGKDKAKEILLRNKKDVTLYDIQKMTEYFVDLFKVSSRDDDSTTEIIEQCRKINAETDPDGEISPADLVKFFELGDEDAKNLHKNLQQTLGTNTISHRSFEKSMVRAHNNCVALGHTLLDAGEVVDVLNKVMVILLFGIVFLAWLLLTDIATTKILLLIASPLLAITFIFGDTCKKIFEGIIFSFINHPFDVGDRCIIDKVEVEVRRMSVLTTTFIGIGTKEEILYPNSALAVVPITNLKGEPDPSDCVELTLSSNHTKSMIDLLHLDINKIFEDDKGIMFEKAISIVVKEIGDSVKMEVQFEHVMSIHEITHSQCFKKKTQQKSLLLLQIKQLIDEINSKNNSTVVEITPQTN